MTQLQITVDGITHHAEVGPHTTLLEWLRDTGLIQVKEGCAEGECGACAVLRVRPDGRGSRLEAINACLTYIAALDGTEVVTTAGLGDPERPHPVHDAMARGGASQCGFCTPGFVTSLAGEYYRPDRSAGQHHHANGVDLHALSGNLCRCTGYRPIVEAARSMGFPEPDDIWIARLRRLTNPARPTWVDGPDGELVRPASLAEALHLLGSRAGAVPLAGGTDLAVARNVRDERPACLVAVDALPELRTLRVGTDHIEIGAALTIDEVSRGLNGAVPLLDALFPQFASPLVRRSATIGGNLGTASPIGDCAPALLALRARVVLSSLDRDDPGREPIDREVDLASYFTGYRQTVRRPDELIRAIRIPLPLAPQVAFHKIAHRRQDDISSVAVAFALDIGPAPGEGAGPDIVRAVTIGLGGIAATPLRALACEEALIGRDWTPETVRHAAAILAATGTPMSDVRASAAYRVAMLEQSLLRLEADLTEQEVAR
ncbi:hypothetical protein KEM60_01982 [Austwickia sp. TVS 96-490-7B]|uniref:xanthine dehydrogenase small subunit n=1 Tax=Austwickia sp. TVS 96-490-7B TaxID=2830843 RepID=UPI001C59D407|nr:FAD binding domain-containing protein [Austwickia sp. TVS 96-490-7B]MBW3085773.1 hypothetical protein [Austwickia sp. TVS 96-490-7B]